MKIAREAMLPALLLTSFIFPTLIFSRMSCTLAPMIFMANLRAATTSVGELGPDFNTPWAKTVAAITQTRITRLHIDKTFFIFHLRDGFDRELKIINKSYSSVLIPFRDLYTHKVFFPF